MTVDPLGDDLAEFLASEMREHDDEAHGGAAFYGVPENADQANRMLRKLRSLQRQRVELDERFDAEVRGLNAWHADRVSGVDREMGELERNLEYWMRGQQEMRGTLTEHLPSGELWLRSGRKSIVIDDDQKVGLWLKQHPAVNVTVRTSFAVDKATLGAAVSPGDKVDGDAGPRHEFRAARLEDGTIVPGVMIRVPVSPGFSVHLNKEQDDV